MKEENYISKGELELYVLDMLSEDERNEVNEHLGDEEVRMELTQIEETLEQMAHRSAMEPSAELRNRIMSAVTDSADEAPLQSRTYPVRYLMAASVSIAMISSILAFVFWQQWQSTEQRLQLALNERTLFADQATFTNHKVEKMEKSMAILSDPSFQQILLNGTEKTPDHQTFVYWNASTKETYLQISQLGELSEDQQYQLWSIQDGKPVDAGVFDWEEKMQLIKMKSNQAPQAFAVTIEPKGGSISPTLESMVVIGNVLS